jgi:hypothetical protein
MTGFFAPAVIMLIMRSSKSLLILLLVAAAVLISGCTQAPGPAAPATPPAPVAHPDLKVLALVPSDLPACFSLSDQRVKSAGDVGNLAKDLGWETGYEVTYSCPAAGPEPTVILHSLAVYPASNVPGIAGMVDRQDRPAGFLYENMSDPDQSFFIRGFSARTGTEKAAGVSPGSFVLAGGKNVSAPASGTPGDFAEFIVYRRNVFEVLKMTGPGANATLLHELARTAAERIP